IGDFFFAGKSDCPFYAKAELLADLLQRSLPDFRVHKISIHPADWKQWLEETCWKNGWKHDCSPLVWRELTDRGGKGLLLGGYNDFMEYVQGYYSMRSDMESELMLKIATENLQTKEVYMQEETSHRQYLHPVHIWISSALNPTCYSLIPQLFTPEVFPNASLISLHLLEIGGDKEVIDGIRMETEDLAWPPATEKGNEDQDKELKEVAKKYRCYGQLIDRRAHKSVRVIVMGDTFINLKCSLLLENARSVDPAHFIALATQLEYEARAQIAQKLNVKQSDVTDIIIWGNITGCSHVDLQRAKVLRYNGAICGPNYSQLVLEMLYDRKWLDSEFQSLVRSRQSGLVLKLQRAAGMQATNGIITVLKAWNSNSSEQVFSLGVLSRGFFGIPQDLVFSMPVSCVDGEWSVLSSVSVNDELRMRLQESISQLTSEREKAAEPNREVSM
uniref:Lactate/malate dehydrogenase C-terminal domain-containing protein n=1 Tax=Denticeps clupeoides TaxID=299321 RepID=A0AAY4ASU6_9TELE